MRDDAPGGRGVQRVAGDFRHPQCRAHRLRRRSPKEVGQAGQPFYAVLVAIREHAKLAAGRQGPTRLVRIGEEGDGRLGANEDEMVDVGEEADHLLREVRDALDRRHAGAPVETRSESVAEQATAARRRDPARGAKALSAEALASQQQRLLSWSSDNFGDPPDDRLVHDRRTRDR